MIKLEIMFSGLETAESWHGHGFVAVKFSDDCKRIYLTTLLKCFKIFQEKGYFHPFKENDRGLDPWDPVCSCELVESH